MDCPAVNLTMVVKEFNAWDEYISDVLKENKLNKNLLQTKTTAIDDANKREEYLLQELKSAREMVNSLQTTLNKRCDMEDENAKLNDKIKKMDAIINTMKDDHQRRLCQVQQESDEGKRLHLNHIEEVKNGLISEASAMRLNMEKTIEDKNCQINSLKKQLVDLEKERQSELMKLRIEYDAKLVAVQKQATKSQQVTSQISSTGQDIFRKKLQHMKAASDQEIANLKTTISDLENKLAAYHPPSALSLNKRKRY